MAVADVCARCGSVRVARSLVAGGVQFTSRHADEARQLGHIELADYISGTGVLGRRGSDL